MSMGCLNNIISNSKYYIYVFWFSVSSALLASSRSFISNKTHKSTHSWNNSRNIIYIVLLLHNNRKQNRISRSFYLVTLPKPVKKTHNTKRTTKKRRTAVVPWRTNFKLVQKTFSSCPWKFEPVDCNK